MNSIDSGQFETYRPLMFSIAYRMLGSISDAEDIVQEAYLRYQASEPEKIIAPKAFLTTVTTRLCLNQLESARVQRETYIGPWLPEPALTALDERFTPAYRAELHESISLAFLALLEQLTPLERAVFLLREVFDYEYEEIGGILGKEQTACRQLLSRAKKHLAENRPRFKPDPQTHRQVLNRFIQAVESGQLEGLLQLLSEDVVMWADSGGKVRGAIFHPLQGQTAVARFLLASGRLSPLPLQIEIDELNGEPGIILHAAGEVRLVISLSVEKEKVRAIHVVGNPEKLNRVNRAFIKSRGAKE